MDRVLAAVTGQLQEFLSVERLGQFSSVARIVRSLLRAHLRQLFCTHTANEIAGTTLFARPPFVVTDGV